MSEQSRKSIFQKIVFDLDFHKKGRFVTNWHK